MHPSHQNGANDRPKGADRLTEWLLTYCPLTTLALLTTLVIGATLGVYWPWPVFAVAGVLDVVLWIMRRRRMKRLGLDPRAPRRPRATA